MIVQLTPNLPVDTIEPSATFFAKVGFSVALRTPDTGPMGFVILGNGSQQVMLQSRKGLAADHSAFRDAGQTTSVMLYVIVDDVDLVATMLAGYDIVMDFRETAYGSKEICFKEPGGHLVTFAQFPDLFLPQTSQRNDTL